MLTCTCTGVLARVGIDMVCVESGDDVERCPAPLCRYDKSAFQWVHDSDIVQRTTLSRPYQGLERGVVIVTGCIFSKHSVNHIACLPALKLSSEGFIQQQAKQAGARNTSLEYVNDIAIY